MNNFWERNRNFGAIIIGAVIIGVFIYAGIKDNDQNLNQPQSFVTSDVAKTSKEATNVAVTDVGRLQNTCGAADNTIVTKVIDGDTVVVEGGYHIRLLGIDADEKGYTCYDPAKTRLEDLVLGEQIRLEKDQTDLDQYGRCLRYIFLSPTKNFVGDEGNTNVDVQLVKEGLAVARFYEPDVKYRTEITAAEQYAQTNHLGCKWTGALQTAN